MGGGGGVGWRREGRLEQEGLGGQGRGGVGCSYPLISFVAFVADVMRF